MIGLGNSIKNIILHTLAGSAAVAHYLRHGADIFRRLEPLLLRQPDNLLRPAKGPSHLGRPGIRGDISFS